MNRNSILGFVVGMFAGWFVCIVSGLALTVSSYAAGLGAGLIVLGVFLIFAGVGLQVLYLYLRFR